MGEGEGAVSGVRTERQALVRAVPFPRACGSRWLVSAAAGRAGGEQAVGEDADSAASVWFWS